MMAIGSPMKGLYQFVTVLPAPGVRACWNEKLTEVDVNDPSARLQFVFLSTSFLHGCNDLLFSGHTFHLSLATCNLSQVVRNRASGFAYRLVCLLLFVNLA